MSSDTSSGSSLRNSVLHAFVELPGPDANDPDFLDTLDVSIDQLTSGYHPSHSGSSISRFVGDSPPKEQSNGESPRPSSSKPSVGIPPHEALESGLRTLHAEAFGSTAFGYVTQVPDWLRKMDSENADDPYTNQPNEKETRSTPTGSSSLSESKAINEELGLQLEQRVSPSTGDPCCSVDPLLVNQEDDQVLSERRPSVADPAIVSFSMGPSQSENHPSRSLNPQAESFVPEKRFAPSAPPTDIDHPTTYYKADNPGNGNGQLSHALYVQESGEPTREHTGSAETSTQDLTRSSKETKSSTKKQLSEQYQLKSESATSQDSEQSEALNAGYYMKTNYPDIYQDWVKRVEKDHELWVKQNFRDRIAQLSEQKARVVRRFEGGHAERLLFLDENDLIPPIRCVIPKVPTRKRSTTNGQSEHSGRNSGVVAGAAPFHEPHPEDVLEELPSGSAARGAKLRGGGVPSNEELGANVQNEWIEIEDAAKDLEIISEGDAVKDDLDYEDDESVCEVSIFGDVSFSELVGDTVVDIDDLERSYNESATDVSASFILWEIDQSASLTLEDAAIMPPRHSDSPTGNQEHVLAVKQHEMSALDPSAYEAVSPNHELEDACNEASPDHEVDYHGGLKATKDLRQLSAVEIAPVRQCILAIIYTYLACLGAYLILCLAALFFWRIQPYHRSSLSDSHDHIPRLTNQSPVNKPHRHRRTSTDQPTPNFPRKSRQEKVGNTLSALDLTVSTAGKGILVPEVELLLGLGFGERDPRRRYPYVVGRLAGFLPGQWRREWLAAMRVCEGRRWG